jgi:hypothetical protein
MQAEGEALHAEGIVGVNLLSLPHRWGGHTTEFFAVGTAVRSLRNIEASSWTSPNGPSPLGCSSPLPGSLIGR